MTARHPLRSRRRLSAAAFALLASGIPALGIPTVAAQAVPAAQAAPAASQSTSVPALPPVTAKQRNRAEAQYLTGAKNLRDGNFKAAEDAFANALQLDPQKPEYLAALAVAQEHRITDLLQQAAQKRPLDPTAADTLLSQARSIDRNNPRVLQHSPQPVAVSSVPIPQPIRTQLAGAIVLQHNSTRHSYHARMDARSLATQLGRDYGFTAILNEDVKSPSLRIDVDDIAYDEAVGIFSMLTHTMMVPLDTHTAIIAADTPENRTRLEHLVEETFYLPGYSADQMKDFISIAQTIFNLKQVVAEPLHGLLVARGPADTLDAVERVFADLLKGTSDVVIDVKLYEIDKQRVRNLGIVLPQSVNGFSLASEAQSVVSQNSALISQLISSGVLPSTATTTQIAEYLVLVAGLGSSTLLKNSFLVVGGGATTAVLSAGNIPTINLALSSSEARMMDDVQLRSTDREKVIFKSGTRYPIQTSIFSDIASGSTSSAAGITVNGVSLSSLLASYLGTSNLGSQSVIPQIQYEDLGLTVEATPRVQHNGEVGMHLEIKVSALAGNSLNGIPILASRQFSSDLTLRDGETALMISNVTDQESAAVSGLPGVSELPGFQSTTNDNGSRITGDLVLLVTPHVTRLGHPAGKGPYIALRPRPESE